jgi:Zn-dependent protease with chaperone function
MLDATPTDHQSAEPTSCPRCRHRLASLRGARWCPECEWNLDAFDPERHDRPFGWKRLDRWAHRTAYRLNARQFAALAGREPAAPRTSPARVAVVVVSAGLLVAIVAMFAGGLLMIATDFPSLAIVPGALLVLIAIVMRPRFGRIDPLADRLSPQQAPTLFGLIGRVAAATGAPEPQLVVVDRRYNAAASAVGLRRRRVLVLGLPLWMILPAKQRVALLAHELGHFANGDIRRGPLTQLAFTTVGTAAALTRPSRNQLDRAGGLFAIISAYFTHLVMSVVSGVLTAIHAVLLWIAMRDAQRAEYLADDRAATAAGSAAVRGLLDSAVTLDAVAPMLARAARASGEVAQWRAAVASSQQRLTDQLPVRHQLSVSEGASLFASHPPDGLRLRMVEARPWRDGTVGLSEAESVQIDAELAERLARARKDIGAPQ